MKELFNDVLGIEDVKGVILFSFKGDIIFKHFLSPSFEDLEGRDWFPFIEAINGIREADLVYENSRLYVRKTGSGYLMVLLGLFSPIVMVRLNCDLLLPSLKQENVSKGLGRIFKRKK